MSTTKPISIKMTDAERGAVIDLVAQGKFQSVSEVIREGIGMLFKQFVPDDATIAAMKFEREFSRPRKRPTKPSQAPNPTPPLLFEEPIQSRKKTPDPAGRARSKKPAIKKTAKSRKK